MKSFHVWILIALSAIAGLTAGVFIPSSEDGESASTLSASKPQGVAESTADTTRRPISQHAPDQQTRVRSKKLPLHVAPSGILRGNVEGSEGKPVVGLRVFAHPSGMEAKHLDGRDLQSVLTTHAEVVEHWNQRCAETVTDQSGSFVLKVEPDTKYKLVIDSDKYVFSLESQQGRRVSVFKAGDTVIARANPANLVRVRVLDKSGRERPEASIYYRAQNSSHDHFTHDWRFSGSVQLDKGSWLIYAKLRMPDTSLHRSEAQLVQIDSDTTQDLTLRLRPQPGIALQITDELTGLPTRIHRALLLPDAPNFETLPASLTLPKGARKLLPLPQNESPVPGPFFSAERDAPNPLTPGKWWLLVYTGKQNFGPIQVDLVKTLNWAQGQQFIEVVVPPPSLEHTLELNVFNSSGQRVEILRVDNAKAFLNSGEEQWVGDLRVLQSADGSFLIDLKSLGALGIDTQSVSRLTLRVNTHWGMKVIDVEPGIQREASVHLPPLCWLVLDSPHFSRVLEKRHARVYLKRNGKSLYGPSVQKYLVAHEGRPDTSKSKGLYPVPDLGRLSNTSYLVNALEAGTYGLRVAVRGSELFNGEVRVEPGRNFLVMPEMIRHSLVVRDPSAKSGDRLGAFCSTMEGYYATADADGVFRFPELGKGRFSLTRDFGDKGQMRIDLDRDMEIEFVPIEAAK